MFSKRNSILFSKTELGGALRSHREGVCAYVDLIPQKQFLELTDNEIIANMIEEQRIIPIRINSDARTRNQEEIKMDVRHNPNLTRYGLNGQTHISGTRVTISTPFEGDPDLWTMRPSSYRSTYPLGSVERSYDRKGGNILVTFEVPGDQDLAPMKQLMDRNNAEIEFYLEQQSRQIEQDLSQWPSIIQQAINDRRQLLNKHNDLDDLLGIPLASKKEDS